MNMDHARASSETSEHCGCWTLGLHARAVSQRNETMSLVRTSPQLSGECVSAVPKPPASAGGFFCTYLCCVGAMSLAFTKTFDHAG